MVQALMIRGAKKLLAGGDISRKWITELQVTTCSVLNNFKITSYKLLVRKLQSYMFITETYIFLILEFYLWLINIYIEFYPETYQFSFISSNILGIHTTHLIDWVVGSYNFFWVTSFKFLKSYRLHILTSKLEVTIFFKSYYFYWR